MPYLPVSLSFTWPSLDQGLKDDLFLKLAYLYFDKAVVEQRLDELLDAEAAIVKALPIVAAPLAVFALLCISCIALLIVALVHADRMPYRPFPSSLAKQTMKKGPQAPKSSAASLW